MVPDILVKLLIVMMIIVIVEAILFIFIVIYNMISDIIDFDDIKNWFTDIKEKLFNKNK